MTLPESIGSPNENNLHTAKQTMRNEQTASINSKLMQRTSGPHWRRAGYRLPPDGAPLGRCCRGDAGGTTHTFHQILTRLQLKSERTETFSAVLATGSDAAESEEVLFWSWWSPVRREAGDIVSPSLFGGRRRGCLCGHVCVVPARSSVRRETGRMAWHPCQPSSSGPLSVWD